MTINVCASIVAFKTPKEQLLSVCGSVVRSAYVASRSVALALEVVIILNDMEQDAWDRARDAALRVEPSLPEGWRIRVICGHGNIGYGAAQNLAISGSEHDYHLVLNPDVELDPECLKACLVHMEQHPADVMAAPRGYDSSGRYARLAKCRPSVLVLALRAISVQPSTRGLGRLVGEYVYWDTLPSDDVVEIELASGCFMLCRSRAMEAIGGFDEGFFLYFEDYDLSHRIRSFGRIVEIPGARIVHHGGNTVGRGLRRILAFCRSGIKYFGRYGWKLW